MLPAMVGWLGERVRHSGARLSCSSPGSAMSGWPLGGWRSSVVARWRRVTGRRRRLVEAAMLGPRVQRSIGASRTVAAARCGRARRRGRPSRARSSAEEPRLALREGQLHAPRLARMPDVASLTAHAAQRSRRWSTRAARGRGGDCAAGSARHGADHGWHGGAGIAVGAAPGTRARRAAAAAGQPPRLRGGRARVRSQPSYGELGCEVEVAACDVADREQLARPARRDPRGASAARCDPCRGRARRRRDCDAHPASSSSGCCGRRSMRRCTCTS